MTVPQLQFFSFCDSLFIAINFGQGIRAVQGSDRRIFDHQQLVIQPSILSHFSWSLPVTVCQ